MKVKNILEMYESIEGCEESIIEKSKLSLSKYMVTWDKEYLEYSINILENINDYNKNENLYSLIESLKKI